MAKIHQILDIAGSYIRAHWSAALFFILSFFLLVIVRINAESYNFGKYHDDEYHTVKQGLNLIVNGSVDNFRAQESARWLVRAFYPYALLSLNSQMGGNVYIDGWSYPGHNYVVTNFVNAPETSEPFSKDPNLRVLFHALRKEYIIFVFACVALLFYFFFKNKYFLTAFGGIVVLGASLDLLTEQRIFYIEPAILASLALFLFAYFHYLFRGDISKKATVLFGFLAAFMLSTKFSTALFLALPIVLFFYLYERSRAIKLTAIYLVSFAASYIMINLPAFLSLKAFNGYIHDISSNFWQYAAGSDPSLTVAPGIQHLGLFIYQLEGFLGYSLYIIPFMILLGIYYADRKVRMILIPLSVILLATTYLLSGQSVFLSRNIIPFYVPIAVVSILSIETAGNALRKWKRHIIIASSVLWIAGILIHNGGIRDFASDIWPDDRSGLMRGLGMIQGDLRKESRLLAVDFPESFFEGQPFEKMIVEKEGFPRIVTNENYPELQSEFASLPVGSIVLVNNIRNNKHLVNYVLPKYFAENAQFGRYYAYWGKK